MPHKKFFSSIIYKAIYFLFALNENKSNDIGTPKKILIIRQHNQLGDMISGISLFRALKEKYPEMELTVVASPDNIDAIRQNKYIDSIILFDKKKLFNPFELISFYKKLRQPFEVCIVPVLVSISFTSNILARISNSKIRIGPLSLEGAMNESYFLFDRRVKLDWRKHPDSNVSDRIMDIVRPFGIDSKNYHSEIFYDKDDERIAEDFLLKNFRSTDKIIVGLHVGAGKPQNRWSCHKYAELIKMIKNKYDAGIYLTGSDADKDEISFVKLNVDFEIPVFMNKTIPEVAALISKSDFFITNDTGIMHVAGSTPTPQLSIFGPTNPFNWAPVGCNKYFIRKSDLIDDINVEDVFNLFKIVIADNKKLNAK